MDADSKDYNADKTAALTSRFVQKMILGKLRPKIWTQAAVAYELQYALSPCGLASPATWYFRACKNTIIYYYIDFYRGYLIIL